jgi:FkbM family methyltransferase
MSQRVHPKTRTQPSSKSIAQLYQMLQPERETCIVDIGANPIDGVPEYWSLYRESLCTIFGFEPHPIAYQALLELNLPKAKYFPFILGDGNPATLHVCRAPGMTSLLKPSRFITTKVFHEFAEFAIIKQEIPVETRRLDDIDIDNLDLIKIDVQGSELLILQNATQKLKEAVMVQTEVSFIPLYEGQPSFATMDHFMRSQGFVPHCFAQINKQPIYPSSHKKKSPVNQLMEADIVYIPNFERLADLSDEKLKHLSLLAHSCYGSSDLAMHCLIILQERESISSLDIAHFGNK